MPDESLLSQRERNLRFIAEQNAKMPKVDADGHPIKPETETEGDDA